MEEELQQTLHIVLSVEEGAAHCHRLLQYMKLSSINGISAALSKMQSSLLLIVKDKKSLNVVDCASLKMCVT